jgi:hypothetical protein
MLQPSGRVCGFPSVYQTSLRSSPIVCLVDAIEVLSLLAYYTLAHKTWPWDAARKVADYRFQDFDENGGFTAVEKSTLVRILVFVLGALPQAVKFYGMSGIPWTKVWGSMYLASFFVNEVIVVMAAKERDSAQSHEQQTAERSPTDAEPQTQQREERRMPLPVLVRAWVRHQNFHGLLAMCIQAGLCYWAVSVAISEGLRTNQGETTKQGLRTAALVFSTLSLIMLYWLLTFAVFAIILLVHLVIHRIPHHSVFIIPQLVLLEWHILFYWKFLDPQGQYGRLRIVSFALTNLGALLLLQYFAIKPQRLLLSTPLEYLFPLINLLASLLYYRFGYDPTGTVKPSWTEILG